MPQRPACFIVDSNCSVVMGNLKLHEGTIFIIHSSAFKNPLASAHFGGTHTKIGTIQRRLAWPLHKDVTQIHEVFRLKKKKRIHWLNWMPFIYLFSKKEMEHLVCASYLLY